MPARINIPIGTEFGKLTVKSIGDKRGGKNQIYWRCLCRCGRYTDVRSTHLRGGLIQSCGKCPRESKSITHGMTHTPERYAWSHAIDYCLNPRSGPYASYGGRGITIYEPWIHDFAAFYAHVGPRPSPHHTLERIENDGNYEPGNVRWATRKEQARNRRSNRLITFQGKTLSLVEWGEIAPVKASTINSRLQLPGWTIERALTEPLLRPRTGRAGRIATKHKRRARVANNGGSFTAQEWLDLCEQFDYRCAACGERKPLTADHIIPVTKGGNSYISNIQPLCTPCNSSKGTKIIDYRNGAPRHFVQLKLVV